jgi:hypothetical protein
VRGLTTPVRRWLKLIRQDATVVLRAGSQIQGVFGRPFGTVWNRFGFDRRIMAVWVPKLTFCGDDLP